VFIFLLPGMIAYALMQKEPELLNLTEADKAFPTMVQALLPVGLRGLVVAGLIAALMSSLSSMFNSCSALFTVDIYHKLRPEASERHLVTVGRFATIVVVVLGILWIPVMKWVSGGGLYVYLQSVQGYLAPPITAVFLLGLFSKRVTSAGAVAGLVSGFILGMAKLTLQAIEGAGTTTMPDWLAAIARFNFLYFSGVLFVIAVVVIVSVSLLTKAPDAAKIANLTFSTCTDEQRRENRASWNAWDVLHTVIILGAVIGIYLFFTFWLR
jgi:SSS family solute:Na+ symporter